MSADPKPRSTTPVGWTSDPESIDTKQRYVVCRLSNLPAVHCVPLYSHSPVLMSGDRTRAFLGHGHAVATLAPEIVMEQQ